jgi:hypothetical protein
MSIESCVQPANSMSVGMNFGVGLPGAYPYGYGYPYAPYQYVYGGNRNGPNKGGDYDDGYEGGSFFGGCGDGSYGPQPDQGSKLVGLLVLLLIILAIFVIIWFIFRAFCYLRRYGGVGSCSTC